MAPGRKLNITASDYFEGFVLKFLGALFIVGAVVAFLTVPWLSALLAALAFLIFTTKYKLAIDTAENSFSEYLWIFGFKQGEKQPFRQVNDVILKPERYVQRIHSFVATKEIHFTMYAIYVRVDGDNQLFAGESKNRDVVFKKATEIARALGVEVRSLGL